MADVKTERATLSAEQRAEMRRLNVGLGEYSESRRGEFLQALADRSNALDVCLDALEAALGWAACESWARADERWRIIHAIDLKMDAEDAETGVLSRIVAIVREYSEGVKT